jgi:hypothetical protein
MLITRYEISIDNGERTVGLILGGWSFGLLSDKDLKFMNNNLKVPKMKNKFNENLSCYFTAEGLNKFGNIVDIAINNAKINSKFTFNIIKKELELEENNTVIVYKDKWQVVITNNFILK